MTQQVLKRDLPISVATEPGIRWLINIPAIADTDACTYDKTVADPVTKTVFLRPMQLEPDCTPVPLAWQDPLPSGWEIVAVGSSANTYLLSQGVQTSTVSTAAAIPANSGIVVSFFVYGSLGVNGNYKALVLGFGGYSIEIYADGRSVLKKGNSEIGEGWLCDRNGNLCGRYTRLLILPFNRRDILFWSDAGGSWVHHDLSLSLNAANNTITSEAAVTVQFPNSKALVQIQRATYPASGSFAVRARAIGYDPSDTTAPNKTLVVYKDTPGESAVTASAAITRNQTSHVQEVTLTLTLSAGNDNHCTPFVYAAEMRWPHSKQTRTGASTETALRSLARTQHIDPELQKASLVIDPVDVDNDSGWPMGMDVGSSVGLYDGSENELFVGLLSAPELLGAQAPSAQLQADSLWKQLKMAVFPCDCRLDGMTDSEVIRLCLDLAGIADDKMEIAEGTQLPADPRGKTTLFPVQAGTTADVVARQIADLMSNWVLTMRSIAGVQKVCYGPESGGESVKTFHQSHLAAGWKHAYWSNLRTWKAPIAGGDIPFNIIVVRGKAIDGDYIYGRYPAYGEPNPQADPNLHESERPPRWYGAPVVKYYVDDRLCNQDVVDHVVDVLKARYIDGKIFASWIADNDDAVNMGSLVTLEGHGQFRVISITPTRHEEQYSGRAAVIGAMPVVWDALTAPLDNQLAQIVGRHHEYLPVRYVGEKVA